MLRNDIKICIENINKYNDKIVFETYYNMVSEERRKKIDFYKFERDKKLSLSVEVMLYKILAEMDIDVANIEYYYGKNGKPYLKNVKNKYFNFSHSENYAMCVVADSEIGCDIEKIKNIDLNIAKRFFFRSEYDNIISKKTKSEQIDTFYKYWVLKESFMKVTGLGMELPLSEFEIILGSDVIVKQKINTKKYIFIDSIDKMKKNICNISNKYEYNDIYYGVYNDIYNEVCNDYKCAICVEEK